MNDTRKLNTILMMLKTTVDNKTYDDIENFIGYFAALSNWVGWSDVYEYYIIGKLVRNTQEFRNKSTEEIILEITQK